MIFKSFNQFLTESNSASFSPVNEGIFQKDEVFKLEIKSADKAQGENYKFSIVAKFNPKNDIPESEALGLLKAFVERSLAGNTKFQNAAKGTIVFISLGTEKQRAVFNDQTILRAILSFRMADRFDMTKATGLTPYIKPGGINIWKDTDMAALSKADSPNVAPNVDADLSNLDVPINTTPQPVVLPAADADVLAFLKDKLLSKNILPSGGIPLGDAAKVTESVGGTVALAKSGVKSREVKFAQLILLSPEFTTAVPALKLATTLGSADGSYGSNTAKAYAILLDDKADPPHNSIEAADIEKLAKYCTLSKLLKPRLQQIWDASELKGGGGGNSGTSGTSGTAGTAGTAGTGGFTYVNKP